MECPAMRKLKHGSVHPKGSRGRAESPLVAAAAAILPAPIKVKKQKCALRRGGGGERKAPFSLPQERNPCVSEKSRYVRKTSYSVAPIWRDNVQKIGRAALGRVCGRAKLLAGTLRCLRLCWRFSWNWSPEKQLGRCPKPHQRRCLWTPQGEIFPLTPFARFSWSHSLTSSACCSSLLHLSPSLP